MPDMRREAMRRAIERQRAEIDHLRRALEPFGQFEVWDESNLPDDTPLKLEPLTVGDFRRARAASTPDREPVTREQLDLIDRLAGIPGKPSTPDPEERFGGGAVGRETGTVCDACDKAERVGDEGWEASDQGLDYCPDCWREPAPPSQGRCDTCQSSNPRVCGCLHLGAHRPGPGRSCCPDPFHGWCYVLETLVGGLDYQGIVRWLEQRDSLDDAVEAAYSYRDGSHA